MCNKCFCGCISSLTIGLIGGIIAGVAYFFLAATLSLPIILWTAFGLTIFSLAVLIFLANTDDCDKKSDKCVCKFGNCILISVIGALIFELILAVTTISVIATAILIGIAAFFLVTAFVSVIKLINCLINASCRKQPCCRD